MFEYERECSLSESTKQQKRKGDEKIKKKSYLKLEENWKIMLVRHSPYCRSQGNMMRN